MRLEPFVLLTAWLVAQDPSPALLPAGYAQAKVLRWGSDAEGGAPFVFFDPADPAREIGFEVDLAAALAADLGVLFVRVQAPWENLLQALDRGDCDVVLNGFEPTADRLPLARFTRAYYLFTQQLVVRKDAGIGSLEDCRERRVGCLGQSQSHAVLLATKGVLPIVYDESLRSFLEVDNGRNAAVLADLPIAQALLPKFASLQLAGEPFAPSPYAIAVRKGEDDLRRALDASLLRLLANGELQRIYQKWGMWNAAQDGLLAAVAPASGDGAEAGFAFGSATRLLLTAALRTVGISVAAFALAVGFGLGLALLRLYGPRPLRYFAIAYVEVFRGTPVLVQLLFLYYGLGQWPSLQMPAWLVGVIGLGLNYAAYEAEVYRGAIAAIPRGQTEAALALGLSGAQCLRFVLLPQALRLSLPASTNDFVALFKDSAVVMVISVVELGKQYQMLASSSGRFLSLGVLTCAMYLAMSLPLAFLARRFERSLDGDRA
jgi:polar amino acid transport system substrate-binding protein